MSANLEGWSSRATNYDISDAPALPQSYDDAIVPPVLPIHPAVRHSGDSEWLTAWSGSESPVGATRPSLPVEKVSLPLTMASQTHTEGGKRIGR